MVVVEMRRFVSVVGKAQMAASCEICRLDEHFDRLARWVRGVGEQRWRRQGRPVVGFGTKANFGEKAPEECERVQ